MIKLFNRNIPPSDGPEVKRFTEKITPEYIASVFDDCADFEVRSVTLLSGRAVKLCFVDGLTSGNDISETVIKPLMILGSVPSDANDSKLAAAIASSGLFAQTIHVRNDADKLVADILNGFCAIVLSGVAVSVEAKSTNKRSISAPTEEKVLKGSKDSFIETLKTNTSLVRRHLRSPDLRIHNITVGRRSNTTVSLMWIEGLTSKRLVNEMKRRIEKIDIDGLISASALEEYVADNMLSPFPQLMHTERPDRFCTELLAGQIGIIADGLPLGFSAPATFSRFFKVPEDRAESYITASYVIALRYFSCVMTLLLPAVFTAIAMYHQEMLPTKLLAAMIKAKQEVPFPTAAEMLMMLFSLELLQEAGMRLPTSIGQTVSIIGALIVGQAAVEAKVVSPIAVIIVALSGIAGYTVPNQDMANALRLWRFIILVGSILAGAFGIAIASALMIHRLCSLSSLGVPYLTPAVGRFGGKALVRIFRPPLQIQKSRDDALLTENERMQK